MLSVLFVEKETVMDRSDKGLPDSKALMYSRAGKLQWFTRIEELRSKILSDDITFH
jgi:hypothetical protein